MYFSRKLELNDMTICNVTRKKINRYYAGTVVIGKKNIERSLELGRFKNCC